MGLLGDIGRGLLETAFPTRCAGCDYPGSLLCERCRQTLPVVDLTGACPRCGAPYGHIVCTECWETEYAFSAARAVGSLQRPLSRVITLYKDGGERRLSSTLADLVVSTAGQWTDWASCVVAVPATKRAVKERGFDHIYTLAEEVSVITDLPVMELLSTAKTRDLRELGREARRREVSGAFEMRADAIMPSHVLLIDDVMTTGSTLDAAALALRYAGAEEVRAVVVARAW